MAWQIAFLTIARDVVRFRPLMLAAIVEKASFAVPTFWLFATGRVAAATAVVAGLDAALGCFAARRPPGRPGPLTPCV